MVIAITDVPEKVLSGKVLYRKIARIGSFHKMTGSTIKGKTDNEFRVQIPVGLIERLAGKAAAKNRKGRMNGSSELNRVGNLIGVSLR
jgi:hypothetical protein